MPTEGVHIDVAVQVGQPLVAVTLQGLGATGEKGDIGDTGPQGPAGIDSDAAFVFTQDVPSDTWNVVHNLGFFPNVMAVDTLMREIIGEVTQIDVNSLIIEYGIPVPGQAYLS